MLHVFSFLSSLFSLFLPLSPSAPLSVGMYNTLLQVYLQNEHRFDPAHFLEEMEKAGVLPNQVKKSLHVVFWTFLNPSEDHIKAI